MPTTLRWAAVARRLPQNAAMDRPKPDFADRSFTFACDIVFLYTKLIRIPNFPRGIAGQILDAGTSVGANLEEGRAASSRRDLTARTVIALKEARETKYWLRLIRATELAPMDLTERLVREADELVAILTTSVRRLRG